MVAAEARELLERRIGGRVVAAASARFRRWSGAASSGRSWSARPKCTSASEGAGRCIPGIFT